LSPESLTYAGCKIKKHFKGKGDYVGDIVGFDGAVYTVVYIYIDGDVETYSEAEIKKLMLQIVTIIFLINFLF
jgi:hypothetical protein